jgi:hypothetical protein
MTFLCIAQEITPQADCGTISADTSNKFVMPLDFRADIFLHFKTGSDHIGPIRSRKTDQKRGPDPGERARRIGERL